LNYSAIIKTKVLAHMMFTNFRLVKGLARFTLFSMFILSGIIACSDGSSPNKPANKGAQRDKANMRAKPEKSIPVELTTIEIGTSASYYVTTATLEPSSDAKINARTSGVVRKIIHEEGDDVIAGAVLLLLEDDDQRLRLKQAKQKFESAKREFDRLNRMKKAGVVSPNEWESANNAYLSAGTDKELAELALSYTRISAPFDGRVVWRDVDLGAHVSTGNLLFRLMAIKPLLLRVHVPANRIGRVAKGQNVELIVDSVDKPLNGIVDLVSPIVDPSTGTIKVTVKLSDYPVVVRPGDFTEIRMITDKRENAMLLPSVAILEERGTHYLYVNEQNKAVRKDITIGYVIADKTEVIEGINRNDKVVSKGQRNLNNGNLLEVISPLNSLEVSKNTAKDQKLLVKKSDIKKERENKRKDS
jgi:membrane fusion protein, multidrug efflux system